MDKKDDDFLAKNLFKRVGENVDVVKVAALLDRVQLTTEEQKFYDNVFDQSVMIFKERGIRVNDADKKRLEMGLKLLIEFTRDEVEYFNVSKYEELGTYLREIELRFSKNQTATYTEDQEKLNQPRGPYTGIFYKNPAPPALDGTAIWYTHGQGEVYYFFLFPVPKDNKKGLKFGHTFGWQERPWRISTSQYYMWQVPDVTEKEQLEVEKAIVDQGLMSQSEMDFFVGRKQKID